MRIIGICEMVDGKCVAQYELRIPDSQPPFKTNEELAEWIDAEMAKLQKNKEGLHKKEYSKWPALKKSLKK